MSEGLSNCKKMYGLTWRACLCFMYWQESALQTHQPMETFSSVGEPALLLSLAQHLLWWDQALFSTGTGQGANKSKSKTWIVSLNTQDQPNQNITCMERTKDLQIFQEEVIYNRCRCFGLGNNVLFACIRATLKEKSETSNTLETSRYQHCTYKIVKETLTLL